MSRHIEQKTHSISAGLAWLPGGWASDVQVSVLDGRIDAVSANAEPISNHGASETRVDILLPALSNLHSHTFQRAFAGMSERRGSNADSFWTWREVMYRFLDLLKPEDVEAIAAFAFMEMQEQGYAAVAEFHYVHHQPGGAPYDDVGELSARIMAAAGTTGVGLTHLPVFYAFGGAGEKPLAGGQLRFGNGLERYLELHAAAARAGKTLGSDVRIGMAPHSLRAVSPESLKQLLGHAGNGPLHIHIAEQQREVDDVTAWLGARPVQWLLANADVSAQWCLIHSTHMTDAETAALAGTGAVAGLCPLTEANLGDGIFNARTFLDHGGRFGVGTDSNINISVTGELSTLEYGQRLKHQQRNVLSAPETSTGEAILGNALVGGAQALGRQSGSIAKGNWADLVALDGDNETLAAVKTSQLVDAWLFACNSNVVTDLWSAGRHCVRDGRHMARDAISANYRSSVMRLKAAL